VEETVDENGDWEGLIAVKREGGERKATMKQTAGN